MERCSDPSSASVGLAQWCWITEGRCVVSEFQVGRRVGTSARSAFADGASAAVGSLPHLDPVAAAAFSIGEFDIARRRQIPHGDTGHLQAQSGTTFDELPLRFDELHERCPDVAAPEYTDSDRLYVARHDRGGYGIGYLRPMTVTDAS